VGGGVIRDVLLNRVPVILEKEIYASAAMVAALIVVLGASLPSVPEDWVSVTALLVCFAIRILALRYHWNLPDPGGKK
ncbi:MAG: trimeric intracellular cation channel family protein, partial [Chitinophagaceae bacterium]